MRKTEIAEIYRFLYNESCRLENLFIIKWNNIYARRNFDTLDLLDLIELSVQMDYLNDIHKRIQKLIEYMRDSY